jgi:hypothetical protein
LSGERARGIANITMINPTKRVTLTFEYPFALKGLERRLAPGQYEVVPDEELIGELSFLPVYRSVSTLIFLPPHGASSIEIRNIDPADLAAAHERDEATSLVAAHTEKQRAQ